MEPLALARCSDSLDSRPGPRWTHGCGTASDFHRLPLDVERVHSVV